MKPETPTDLPAAVWNILKFHYGESNRITKADIALQIFDESVCFTDDGKLNDTIDRNIRDAVAGLVTNKFYPIVSTSDGAGYFVAKDIAEAQHAIAELDSRIGALAARKKGIITGLTGTNVAQPSFF